MEEDNGKNCTIFNATVAEYDQQIQQSFVRDVDSVVQKLNTTFQQDLKDELEAVNFYLA